MWTASFPDLFDFRRDCALVFGFYTFMAVTSAISYSSVALGLGLIVLEQEERQPIHRHYLVNSACIGNNTRHVISK